MFVRVSSNNYSFFFFFFHSSTHPRSWSYPTSCEPKGILFYGNETKMALLEFKASRKWEDEADHKHCSHVSIATEDMLCGVLLLAAFFNLKPSLKKWVAGVSVSLGEKVCVATAPPWKLPQFAEFSNPSKERCHNQRSYREQFAGGIFHWPIFVGTLQVSVVVAWFLLSSSMQASNTLSCWSKSTSQVCCCCFKLA